MDHLKKRHAREDYSAIPVRATPSHAYMGVDRPFVAHEAAGIGAERKVVGPTPGLVATHRSAAAAQDAAH